MLLNKAEQLLRKSLKKARFRMPEVKPKEKLLPWFKLEARRRKAKNRRMSLKSKMPLILTLLSSKNSVE